MKAALSLLTLSLLLACPSLKGEERTVSPLEAIREKGVVIVSDGSSFYTLRKDGSFASGPLAEQGRAITGTWKPDERMPDRRFVIEGNWSWINGKWPANDRRRMVLDILPGRQRKTTEEERRFTLGEEFLEGYFLVEELVPLGNR